MAINRKTLFYILIFTSCILYSQESKYFHYQHTFKHLTNDDGLANDRVEAICQDHKGFMWFGTNKGLSRYDGYTFVNYKADVNDSSTIIDRRIYAIILDSKKNLIFCTNSGLRLYNTELDNFSAGKNNILSNITKAKIFSICEDNNGNLWTSAILFDIWYLIRINLEKNEFEKIVLSEKLKDKNNTYIKSIQTDKNNNLWFNNKFDGFYFFNTKEKKLKQYTNINIDGKTVALGEVECVFIDENGDIMLGSSHNGIITYSPELNVFKRQLPSNDYNKRIKVRKIAKDSKGNYWIASIDGLHLFDKKNGTFKKYADDKHPVSVLNHKSVKSLFIDNNNGLWVGTFAGGVSYTTLGQTGFVKYNHSRIESKNYISDKVVYSLAEDDNGNIIIGTENAGLNILNRITGEYEKYPFDPDNINSPRSNNIKTIVVDHNNRIWLGAYNGGISSFNTTSKKFTHYLNDKGNPNSLVDNKVYSLFFDSEKTLWVSNNSAISYKKYNSNSFHILDYKSTEYKNDIKKVKDIRSIIEDKNNNIWICGYRILIRVSLKDKKVRTYFREGEHSSTFKFQFVYEDKNSNIWISDDNTDKLFLYNQQSDTFKYYTPEHGLPEAKFLSMYQDEESNFWLSSDDGIYKFENLANYPDTIIYKRYGIADNLQSKVFLYGSYSITRDGEILFGGTKGFNSFYPKNIKPDTHIPSLAFTGLRIFNRKIKPGEIIAGDVILNKVLNEMGRIRLNHKIGVFTIEFAALHFSAPKQNKYKYMLEGIDEHWTEVDASQRFATYSKLPAGDYTFKVMGANKDGVWNPQPILLKLDIVPPFWKTWWFRLLLVTFIVSSAVIFYFVRINQIKMQKIHLERQVELRTHELKEANVNLQSKQEEVLAQNEEIQQQSEEITAQRDAVAAQNEEIKSQKEQVSKAYDNIKIISEFGQRITAQLNLKAINSMIYNYVTSLMNVSAFGIGVFNDKRNQIEYIGYMEEGKSIPPFANKMEDKNSLSVWCLTNNKEITINDYDKDYKKYITGEIPIYTKKRPESFLYVPLIADKKKIGVMTAQSYNKDAYSDNDLTNMQSLASYISIALDNANFYNIVTRQNKKITSSIEYAKNIQDSILPMKENIDKHFETFILFRPKDIVSGDFYWYTTARNEEGKEYVFIAAIDCTGHGVPGAFMSLIGYRVLNEVVNQQNIHDTAKILEYLNIGVQLALKQEQTNNNDGMDACLVRLEKVKNSKTKIMYTGAKNSLYYTKAERPELQKLGSDRKSIGGIRARRSKISYTTQEIELNKGEIIYLPTDGIVDQNGPARNKYGTKRFVEFLNRIKALPMHEQKEVISTELMVFMDEEDQRDDITLIGVRM